MELGQVEAFERVAREGSFTRAAETMGLTQPAVSTRITSLETELGSKLFERRGRQLYLTPLGERFLPYAQRMLTIIEEAKQDVRSFHQGRLGEVKIAAPTPFILSFLVDVLEHFRQQFPNVDILIRERAKTTIVQMIYDRTITLGLVNAPVFDKNMAQIARFEDPIRAIAGSEHPLASEVEPLTMADIYQHTIFRVSMFPQMTAFIDSVVENAREGSGGAVIAVPMVMALQLVTSGQGVTFLPQSYIKQSIIQGDLKHLHIIDMPRLMSQPVLIAHKNRKLDDVHLEFIEILKNRLSHLVVK